MELPSTDAAPNPTASEPIDGPLVTIGLPVFNASRYLAECLDSLVGQTYRSLRIVISDNASTDDSVAICEEYASHDERVRIFRSDINRGAGWNHQRVLELAEGAYFKWCGADDIIGPRFVAGCVAALEAQPKAVLAFPLTTIIDDDGKPVLQTVDRLPVSSPDDRVRFEALLSPWSITHSAFYGLIRRSVLATVRPFGDFLAADRSFLAELAVAGPFVQVEEYTMFRRHHEKHARQTEKSERALLNPTTAAKFRPREFRLLREHLLTALRAPGPSRKLRLLASVARWAVASRWAFIVEMREYVLELSQRTP